MTPGMPLVTLAAGDHGLVSDTVGLFTVSLLLQGLTIPMLMRATGVVPRG